MKNRILAVAFALTAAVCLADGRNALARLTPILHHVAEPRQTLSLCGEWDWGKYPNKVEKVKEKTRDGKEKERKIVTEPAVATAVAGIKKWQKTFVPGELSHWGDAADAYLRRSFDVPADWIGRRMKLHFELAYQSFLVFVNGVDCGFYRRWGVPTDVDVTKAVKAGRNEIVVVIRCDGARLAWEDGCDWRPNWGGGMLGIRGALHLEVMDKVYVADVIQSCTVATNAAENALAATVVVANDTDAPRRVRVTAAVQDVWTAPAQEVDVPARGRAEVKFAGKCPTIDPWTPDTPNLYFIDVRLFSASAANPIDAFRRRFGFCQVRIAKDRILFNNHPVLLRRGGDGGGSLAKGELFRNFALDRHNGSVGARVWSDWERRCDAADEFGYFFTPVASQGWGSAYRNQEKFWPVYRQHLKEWVEALRHHPCILYWCASNEFGTIYGGNEGGPMEEPTQKRQVEVQSQITVFDRGASRPWEACGEVEVGYPVKGSHGPAPIRSYHYPIPYNSDGNELPEAAYWYDKGSPAPWQRIATRDKPTSISEDLYHGMADQHLGLSRFAGDGIYMREGYAAALRWAGATVAEGIYAAGITTWEPWVYFPERKYNRLYEGRSVHPDYLVALRDFNRSLRSGVPETRTAYLYNQNFETVRADCRCVFRLNGLAYAATNEMVTLTPGCKLVRELTIPTPSVKGPSKLEIDVLLRGPGPGHDFKCLEKRTFAFTVYPEEASFDGGEKCALLADAASPLARRGKWTKGVHATGAAAADSGAKRIVVAKSLTATDGKALEEFVEDGGRVLLLEADEKSWTPIDLVFRRPVAFAFRRDDAAMPEVGEEMMRVWRGDSALGGASYPKPREDAAILWDCGHKDGLDSFLVGWVYRNEGAYLLCQLPVLSRLETEPAAGFVLKSVLGEFAREREAPEGAVAYAGGAGMRATLEKAGVPLSDSLRKAKVVWVDVPTNGLDAALSETLEKALRREQTVFVSGLRATNATALLARWGLKALIPPAYQGGTKGRRVDTGVQWFCRRDNAGLLAGLCNDDFFWRNSNGMDAWGYACYTDGREPNPIWDPKKGPTMLAAYAVLTADYGAAAKIRTDPACLAEAPLGDEGARVVFLTVDFEGNYPKASAKVARVIRTLLNNCGVKTSVPQPVSAFELVDIAGSFNRALWHDPLNRRADGTYEPKGWFEGPDPSNDMRFYPVNLCGWSIASNNMCPREPWPTEPMRMGPVSFKLPIEDAKRTGSKACLVIDPGEELKITLPKPVKASRLWFLGCSSQVGAFAVEMRVNGAGEPIVFTGGDHFGIYRWNDSVKTGVIGWTGYTMKDSMASLYVWPAAVDPETEIRFLSFRNTYSPKKPGDRNQLAILGLTLEHAL